MTQPAELPSGPADWTDRDGRPIGCVEKRRVLAENEAELQQVLRDAFEDAILIGVGEPQLRERLHALVDRLRSPLA